MNSLRLIHSSLLATFLSLLAGMGLLHGQQGMLAERWNSEVPMMGIDLFRREINLRAPDVVSQTSSGLSMVEVAGNHGMRLRGRLVAPETSDYTFFVSGDDQCELWLSPDSSPFDRELICWSHEYTSTLWNKLPSQRSRSILLQRGQSYYIEGLMSNWGGADYLALGWKRAPVAVFGENSWGGATGVWTDAGDGLRFSVSSGDLAGNTDDGLLRRREWTGKGEFIVKLSELNLPDSSAKAGLMMRAHEGDNSRYGMVFKMPDGTTAFQYRLLDAGDTVTVGSVVAGEWLRLVKSANDLTASVSVDRVTWTAIGSVTFASLPVTYLVGTAASSNTGSAGVPATGKFSQLEALNLLSVEIIPGNSLVHYTGDAEDLHDDPLPDSWETANGLDPTNPYGDEGAYSDPDGDSLTNQVEYHYGLSPRVADQIANTLLIERWNAVAGSSVDDLTSNPKFYDRPDSMVLAAPGNLQFPSVFFGSRIRGSITPLVSGTYTFWISARTSGEIWLSTDQVLGKYAKQLVASLNPKTGSGHGIGSGEPNLWDRFPTQQSRPIFMEAGKSYPIEILHQSGFGLDAHASIAWARDGGPREILPASVVRSFARSADDLDDDCLPDAWENHYGLDSTDNGLIDRLKQGERGDYDGDGLDNRTEFLIGTDPADSDTDGDGESDGVEVNSLGSNALVMNAITDTLVGEVALGSYVSSSTHWTMTSGGLLADSFRGEATWDFSVPSAGNWLLRLDAELMGATYGNESVPVSVRVDGKVVVRKDVHFGSGKFAVLQALTPWLRAGSHQVSILVDNALARRTVRLVSLRIYDPANAEAMLAQANRIIPHNATSRTSPVCLEGYARDVGSVEVDGLPVTVGTGNGHWFTNFPLDDRSAAQSYSVKFEKRCRASGSITWLATNVMDGESLTIRQGDALRVGAWNPAGSHSSTITASFGGSWSLNRKQTAVITFANAGTFTLSATLQNGTTGVLTVKCVSAPDFTTDEIDLLDNAIRLLVVNATPEIAFDAPEESCRLLVTRNGPSVANVALLPGRTDEFHLAARLFTDGSILAAQRLNVIGISDALQNDLTSVAASGIMG